MAQQFSFSVQEDFDLFEELEESRDWSPERRSRHEDGRNPLGARAPDQYQQMAQECLRELQSRPNFDTVTRMLLETRASLAQGVLDELKRVQEEFTERLRQERERQDERLRQQQDEMRQELERQDGRLRQQQDEMRQELERQNERLRQERDEMRQELERLNAVVEETKKRKRDEMDEMDVMERLRQDVATNTANIAALYT